MPVKDYYYNFPQLDTIFGVPSFIQPFLIGEDLNSFLTDILGENNYTGVQTDVTDATVNKLFEAVINKYYKNAIVRIELPFDTPESYLATQDYEDELRRLYKEWIWKFLALLDETSPYYLTILSAYDGAKTELMDDITAISRNKVKFNDTPQNANTSDVYEGDNYITNFTATEGESSSPLMSKIMRLKEIQDHYKNTMADWVKEFQKIFYEVEMDKYDE